MSGIKEDVTLGGYGSANYGGYGGVGYGGYGFGGFGGFGGGCGIVPVIDVCGKDRGYHGYGYGKCNELGREIEMTFDVLSQQINSLKEDTRFNHTDDIIERNIGKVQAQLGEVTTRNEIKFEKLSESCGDIKGLVKDTDYHTALMAKDHLHYMDKGFCEIMKKIDCDGDKTRALINSIDKENLRDKLCKAENEASQLKQNLYIDRLLDNKISKGVNDAIYANFGSIKTDTNNGVKA